MTITEKDYFASFPTGDSIIACPERLPQREKVSGSAYISTLEACRFRINAILVHKLGSRSILHDFVHSMHSLSNYRQFENKTCGVP